MPDHGRIMIGEERALAGRNPPLQGDLDQPACKPGSVGPVGKPTDVAAIPLGRPLPAASSNQPGRRAWRAGLPSPRGKGVSPLFGFAPGGVYHAGSVAGPAVRSYRTFSPLLASLSGGSGSFSVALSLGSPPPDVIRHRMSMEPGLSSPAAFRHLPERPSGRLTRPEWSFPASTSSHRRAGKILSSGCRSVSEPFDWMSAVQPNKGASRCNIC